MKIHELQYIVLVEAICLLLILVIIVAAFKRWKRVLIASCALATIAFFSAWSNIMAMGSLLVYGSASTLLWWQAEKKTDQPTQMHKKVVQRITWGILATGVAVLILNNTRNIFVYLQ